jgi:Hsp70 protein
VGWGPDIADALAPTGYPKPGVQKVEWFKLQLMMSGNTYIDPINLPPLPPGKSEIDVAADYLYHLRQAMRNQLQKTLGEVFNREERNIRYYLTVPAIWNDAAKAATRAAAIQAGFLRDENDNRLTLVTEPEAAAMFCSKTGLLNLKIHDAVLIVDCGGGTVDLIAYEVEEEQPFSVSECTAGSGDSCGSTALNRNFSNILRAKIRKMKLPDGSRTAGKVYAKCIMDFENRIKADFRNNGQKWAVDVGIEAEFPEAGIEEGYMTFTNEEILQCFEPVVNRILELVRNQIIAIQAQNRNLQVSVVPLFVKICLLTFLRISLWSVVLVHPSTSSSRLSFMFHLNSNLKLFDLWTLSLPLLKVLSRPVSLRESSHIVSPVDITSWQHYNHSRKDIIQSNIVCQVWMERTDASIQDRFLYKRVSV